MDSAEQKALLKKVYEKRKSSGALNRIPSLIATSDKKKKKQLLKEQAKTQTPKAREKEALRNFRLELSKGSDKKLKNMKKKG